MNLSDILRGGMSGLTTGFVGGPVDILNMIMGAVGAPVSEKPVMGSDWLNDKLGVQKSGSTEETLAELISSFTTPGGAAKAATVPALLAMRTGGKAADALKATKATKAKKAVADLSPMPEMADRYPQTSVPVSVLDPNKNKGKGEYFAQKQNSEEAGKVEAIRKSAQKRIDKGDPDYRPFFDVSKRSDVDEVNYPRDAGNTLQDALPKTAKKAAEWKETYDTPEVRRRLLEAFIRGSGDKGAKNWYAMRQLEEEFVKELGPEAGRAAFKERFAVPMAATTGGADPTANLLTTAYANYVKQGGKQFPMNRDGSAASYDLPYPIGGRYVGGNIEMADNVMMKGGLLSAEAQPKRYNFSGNFMGRKGNATIDEQMMTLFEDPKAQRFADKYQEYLTKNEGKKPMDFEKWFAKNRETAPPGASYGVLEAILADVAKQAGVSPMNFQDVAWRGAKGGTGHPMMEEVNQMLYRTGKVTGKPEDEVLRGFIRANMPMYGMGAGAIGLPFLLGGESGEQ